MTTMTRTQYKVQEEQSAILDASGIDAASGARAVMTDLICEADTRDDLPDPVEVEDLAYDYVEREIQETSVPRDKVDLRRSVAEEEAEAARFVVEDEWSTQVEEAFGQ